MCVGLLLFGLGTDRNYAGITLTCEKPSLQPPRDHNYSVFVSINSPMAR
jgi:hypothetical protein